MKLQQINLITQPTITTNEYNNITYRHRTEFYVDYITVNAQSYYTHIFDDGIFKTKVAGLQTKVICYSKRVK